MRILKTEQYINEKLTIHPVTKDRLAYYKKLSVDGKTRQFIKNHNLIWNQATKSYGIIPFSLVDYL